MRSHLGRRWFLQLIRFFGYALLTDDFLFESFQGKSSTFASHGRVWILFCFQILCSDVPYPGSLLWRGNFETFRQIVCSVALQHFPLSVFCRILRQLLNFPLLVFGFQPQRRLSSMLRIFRTRKKFSTTYALVPFLSILELKFSNTSNCSSDFYKI